MMQSFAKFQSVNIILIFLVFGFSGPVFSQSTSLKFDDFNRANNVVVGIPSNGTSASWTETESTGSNDHRARIESNMLVLSSRNNLAAGSAGMEQVVFDATNQYANVFNQAASELTWAFNFRQSKTDPSGFGAISYGIAYVLGSSKANFKDPDAVGYALIIGNTSTPDPVKLIKFKNGLTANSNITPLITSTEVLETAYYSVKVTFEPCSKTWSLQVRNDNGVFADPFGLAIPALTTIDQTYTNSQLNFTGAAYNHNTVDVTAYFDNIYLPNATVLLSQTYNWNGLINADFNEPGNWSPTRTCNRATDILSFNSGGTVNLINVSSQEIGQLLVQNNTTLILKAKTGATQTLQISGGQGEDLLVTSGSNLIIDSNDALEISLKTGVTGKVGGIVTVQNTSQNLGRAHKILVADTGALVFESGSQFVARHLTGEPFGNTGTANVVIFKQNAIYIAKDGASPFGLTSPNSKVVFETGSLYKHEQTGTAPKFDGRIYADFELNVSGNVAINFGTSAVTTTQIDNFLIRSGNLNISLGSGTTPLPMQIKGDLIVEAGAALNYMPAAVANTSLIILNGAETQQISGNINLGQFTNLEINNPSGVNLQSPFIIRGNLKFTSGILTTNNNSTLNFEDNATVTGASNVSYFSGRIIKTGDDAFTFPTGKNGFYAPIAISAPIYVTDQYAAEYFQTDPAQLFGTQASDSLVQISSAEYWDLSRIVGNSEVKVTLSYDVNRSGLNSYLQDLRIAHFKAGLAWFNEGRRAGEATSANTLITTPNAQSSYSPFTFGSISANNALPVELINFQVYVKDENAELTWETVSEVSNSHFEIERSQDGKEFNKIGQVAGQGTSNTLKRYHFSDKNRSNKLVYYRLKQVDLDGLVSYSKIITLNKKVNELNAVIYPNPASEFIKLNLQGPKAMNIEIRNLLGQVIKTIKVEDTPGELSIDISQLQVGSYFMKVNNSQQALRFIKAEK